MNCFELEFFAFFQDAVYPFRLLKARVFIGPKDAQRSMSVPARIPLVMSPGALLTLAKMKTITMRGPPK